MASKETQESWISKLAPTDKHNERHFLALLACFGFPKTYLDIGCGTGAMVNIARKLGITAFGIDQIARSPDYFVPHDLRKPFNFNKKFELITCLEVIEHIEPEYTGVLLKSLFEHVREGTLFVFSAANPSQDSIDHYNLLPAYMWRRYMHDLGFSYREDYTTKIALLWSNLYSPLEYLAANVQVFEYGSYRRFFE